MATSLTTDGNKKEVMPANGRSFTLEEMQKLIGGGYIEVLALGGDLTDQVLVVDEEGKLKRDFIINVNASELFRRDLILGDALLCTRTEAGFNE